MFRITKNGESFPSSLTEIPLNPEDFDNVSVLAIDEYAIEVVSRQGGKYIAKLLSDNEDVTIFDAFELGSQFMGALEYLEMEIQEDNDNSFVIEFIN